jgi:hypothetical protein
MIDRRSAKTPSAASSAKKSSALKHDPATKKAAIIASKGTLDWAYPPPHPRDDRGGGRDGGLGLLYLHGLNIIHKDFESSQGVPGERDADADSCSTRQCAAGHGRHRNNDEVDVQEEERATIRELLDAARESGVTHRVPDDDGRLRIRRRRLHSGRRVRGCRELPSEARRAHLTLFI